MDVPHKIWTKPLCRAFRPFARSLLLALAVLLVISGAQLGLELPSRAEQNVKTSLNPKGNTSRGAQAQQQQEKTRYILAAPQFDEWSALKAIGPTRATNPDASKATSSYPNIALARYFKTDIFASVSSTPYERGYLRRGERVQVKAQVHGQGCSGGRWYPVNGGGYVCTKHGVTVAPEPGKLDLHFSLPDASKAVPYKYGKVITKNAQRLHSIPSLEEDSLIEASLKGTGGWPKVVERGMDGVFFLALHGSAQDKGRDFFRTVYGRYVRKQDVKLLVKPTAMHGELLGKGPRLPLAFVYGEDRASFREENGELEAVGLAAKHARFPVAGQLELGGKMYVRGSDGVLLARDEVRLLEAVDRPGTVPAGSKWIHVDIAQQSLVAYEGDRPVFATLISGGREGYEAPKGLFRVQVKHVTVTMKGPDPVDKWYEVEEVPWTLFYHEGYAIHGAYWHNDFGKPRSHGCTNLAPVDARWLFYWSEPTLPKGWHGMRSSGTYIYVTG